MAPQRFCQDCNQKHDRQSVYEQLGNTAEASVTIKVVLAFLLPLIIFIITLAVSERVFARTIDIEKLQIILSLLTALLATFVCIFIIKVINR